MGWAGPGGKGSRCGKTHERWKINVPMPSSLWLQIAFMDPCGGWFGTLVSGLNV